MTNDNRRRNIADEVTRAEEARKSARILQHAGQHGDAVSRAYYACFYYARALLLMSGREARRHGGVDRLLQRDLVSTGKLAPEVARPYHDSSNTGSTPTTPQATSSPKPRPPKSFKRRVSSATPRASF